MSEFLIIDIEPELQKWIDYRLAQGRHEDAGDLVRDLIRRDQEGILGDVRPGQAGP